MVNYCKSILFCFPMKIMQHIQDPTVSGTSHLATFTFSHLQTRLAKVTYEGGTKPAKKHSQREVI